MQITEHPFPAAEQDGEGQQSVLIDLVMSLQVLEQLATAEDQDLAVSVGSKALHVGR